MSISHDEFTESLFSHLCPSSDVCLCPSVKYAHVQSNRSKVTALLPDGQNMNIQNKSPNVNGDFTEEEKQ